MHESATWPTLNQHTLTQPDNLALFQHGRPHQSSPTPDNMADADNKDAGPTTPGRDQATTRPWPGPHRTANRNLAYLSV